MKRNLNLKSLVVFIFALSFIFGLSVNADAQRRTRSKRSRKAKTRVTNASIVKKGAKDVGIQVKNVTKFVFVLGGVAKGIEDIDKDVRAGRATREIENKNVQFKEDVIASIRGLRAGLIKLESDFRTKAPLKKYLLQIQGLTQQANKVEDLAMVGQFSDAGKELLMVVELLTDTLVAMP